MALLYNVEGNNILEHPDLSPLILASAIWPRLSDMFRSNMFAGIVLRKRLSCPSPHRLMIDMPSPYGRIHY